MGRGEADGASNEDAVELGLAASEGPERDKRKEADVLQELVQSGKAGWMVKVPTQEMEGVGKVVGNVVQEGRVVGLRSVGKDVDVGEDKRPRSDGKKLSVVRGKGVSGASWELSRLSGKGTK